MMQNWSVQEILERRQYLNRSDHAGKSFFAMKTYGMHNVQMKPQSTAMCQLVLVLPTQHTTSVDY